MGTFVQSKSADLGSVTSGNITFNSSTVNANMLSVAARIGVIGRTLTVTDSKSNSFTQRANQPQTTDGHELITKDAVNIAGGASHQVTFAISGAAATMRVGIAEGAPANTNPWDAKNQAQADGTSAVSAGSVTNAQATAWLIVWFSCAGSGATAFTAGTGYTKREELVAGTLKLGMEEKDVASIASYAGDATSNSPDNFSAVVKAYKVGAGAGGPVIPVFMHHYRQQRAA